LQLLYFILSAYGLTQILVYSTIFAPYRPKHHFFHCPMCVGFWVGVFLVSINGFTELFTFDVSMINAFLMGCLSSGTSYALCMLISDGGFQYEHRTKRDVDAKVDVKTSNQLLQG
jgi:hypothetical protein